MVVLIGKRVNVLAISLTKAPSVQLQPTNLKMPLDVTWFGVGMVCCLCASASIVLLLVLPSADVPKFQNLPIYTGVCLIGILLMAGGKCHI